jgi:transposase-like protein
MKQMTSETKQQQLEWRRSKVLELASEGHSQRQIAQKLNVDLAAVNRDIQFLRQQAKENLQKHITETLPHEYEKSLLGINQVLVRAWSIVNNAVDDKVKLQALTLINDCNKYKMDLTTNGSLVMDSVKVVQNQLNHLNGMERKFSQATKKQEDIEEERQIIEDYQHQEEPEQQQNTTNGIF